MAECLINDLGGGEWKAYSAGSYPTGKVNPLSIEVLKEKGHSVEGLRSKSWDEFTGSDTQQIDLVITVCDNAAGEVCPIWPGCPSKVHIGFPDPAAATGTHEERLAEFRAVYGMIETKVHRLIEMGLERAGEL
jgi:arsenate reductase